MVAKHMYTFYLNVYITDSKVDSCWSTYHNLCVYKKRFLGNSSPPLNNQYKDQ